MDYQPDIRKYINGLIDLLQRVDVEAISNYFNVLERARQNGSTIFIFGNGGSGATASHTVCDFNKGCSRGRAAEYRMVCLNDNVPSMLAYANDISYDDVFVGQLRNLMRPGDVVIGISGSGNSPNIIKAMEYANANGGITVGLCGYGGGRLKTVAGLSVHVDINDMQKVEDVHMMFSHIACQVLGTAACG